MRESVLESAYVLIDVLFRKLSECLRMYKEIFSQDIIFTGRDSKQAPPEHKAESSAALRAYYFNYYYYYH
jgi:hypothetical protein